MNIKDCRAIGCHIPSFFMISVCLLSQDATAAVRRGRLKATTYATITRAPKRTKMTIPTLSTGPSTTYHPTIPPQTLRSSQEIIEAMKKHEIIPDLMSKAPENIKPVLVKFEGNSTADLGNHLCVRDIEYWAPLIQWPANETQFYTMMMLNLDMPTRNEPGQREYLMWLVGNIPDNWIMRGDQILEYEEPDPTKENGSQRYVVLIYHQTKGKIKFRDWTFDLVPKVLPQECRRQKFSSQSYAAEYGLHGPIGINFWESHYEKEKPFSPILDYDYMIQKLENKRKAIFGSRTSSKHYLIHTGGVL